MATSSAALSRATFQRPALKQAAARKTNVAPKRNPFSRSTVQVAASAFSGSGSDAPKQRANILKLGAARKVEGDKGKAAEPRDVSVAFGGGGGKGGNGGSGGGGGGGGGGDSGDYQSSLAAVGRKLTDFPTDFAGALASGTIGAGALYTWIGLEKNPLAKFLLFSGGQGFRERLLGDPLFLAKLGIEIGVGVCTKLTAEKTKRAGDFLKELDFVVANVIMAILADFALTWLPAPTLPLSPKLASGSNALARFLQNCPDNAFQMATATRKFTVVQRFAAILRNGAKLFAVGTGASFIGTGITNGIIAVRQKLEPATPKQTEDMNLVTQSLAYGLYMSVSSNLRYQIVAGIIEERGIERVLGARYPLASSVASFVVRTGNTFVGSLLWVDFVRLLGLQKQVKAPEPVDPKAKGKKAAPAKDAKKKPAAAAAKGGKAAADDKKKK